MAEEVRDGHASSVREYIESMPAQCDDDNGKYEEDKPSLQPAWREGIDVPPTAADAVRMYRVTEPSEDGSAPAESFIVYALSRDTVPKITMYYERETAQAAREMFARVHTRIGLNIDAYRLTDSSLFR